MKNKFLLTVLLIGILLITGCTTKEKLEPNQFKTMMEKKGFIVEDQTVNALSNQGNVELSYIATSSDQRYSIEYYSFDGEVSAQGFFAKKQEELKATGSQASTELNMGNYSKYTLIYNGTYSAVSRVSNTAVYVKANNNYSEEIKQLLLDIGY